MTFQIARIVPTYCQFRDGVIGSRAQVLPMTYFSADLACRLAERLSAAAYEEGDDEVSFVSFKTGTSPFSPQYRSSVPSVSSEDLPF